MNFTLGSRNTIEEIWPILDRGAGEGLAVQRKGEGEGGDGGGAVFV